MKSVMLTALTAALIVTTSAQAGSGGAAASLLATQADRRGDPRVERQAQQPPAQNADRQGRREGRDGSRRDAAPGTVVQQVQPNASRQGRRDGVRPSPAPQVVAPQAQPNAAWQARRDGARRAPAPPVLARQAPPPNTAWRGDRDGRRDGDWNNNGRDRSDWGDRNDGRGHRDGQWDRHRGDRDHGRRGYDPRRWPQYVQPRQTYRWYGPVWINPPGYSYRSYSYGQRLPSHWYAPRYYLNDYWRYGLPTPPIGFEWLRLGRDAVLVDVFDGRIYEVVRNLFW